jgi:L-seryl-tRNA(Ser) seleniumtransferase
LSRILRVGKLTLVALEATLALFLDEAKALREVPTLRMLCRRPGQIGDQADRIAESIGRQAPNAVVSVVDGFSQMGSGSLPTQNLATRLVAIQSNDIESGELAGRLRCGTPPVFSRVHKGQLLLDPRTVLDGEEDVLVRAVIAALQPRA